MSWIKGMLSDGIDGSVSSKRVITFLAFLLCGAAFIANLFFGMMMERFMFETMAYIVMAGLGVTVAEKFSSRQSITAKGTPLPKQDDPLL